MAVLFYDTETTGMANWNADYKDASQPKLVQLAAILRDDDGVERGSINLIVQPNGWDIPDAAARVHRITTKTADLCGGGLDNAVHIFSDFVDIADEIVAHNAPFDQLIMQHAAHMVALEGDLFAKKKITCTMRPATGILRIPQRGGKGLKWPKLEECYQYFFNEKLEGAHDALVDVRACARVYDELKKMEVI